MIHTGNKGQVSVDGSHTGEFSMDSGVLQGNVLSPLLFAIVIDFVMKETAGGRQMGIEWVDGKKLMDLDYADDLVLMSDNLEEIREILDRMVRLAKGVGLKINAGKTKSMRNDFACQNEILLNGEPLEDVENFKYLGVNINKSGSLEKEFKERIKKANQTVGMLSRIWKSNRLSIHIKIRLYISLVRSVLLYGFESWYDNQNISNRFRIFENKVLRRILGIKWSDRIRNTTIREVTEVPCVDRVIMDARWRWLGHVMRRDNDRLVKQNVLYQPIGTRRLGRPSPTWKKTMMNEAGDGWNNVEVISQDRAQWKDYCEALCVRRHWRI
jgi:hypothetical protein